METDSEPPSTMDLADLQTMALNPPDEEAANLCAVPAQETIALPLCSYSTADSPFESSFLIDYRTDMDTRIGTLLDYDLYTDVTFFVGEHKFLIKAHKLILSLASPVFASMFNGKLKSENEISIPDCKPEAFNSLLRFVYKNIPLDDNLGMEDCIDVLYVARKYNICGLEDNCHLLLCVKISEENVFDLINASSFYDLSGLSAMCWRHIEQYTQKVLSFHMPDIELEKLIKIMENDKLNIREIDLFELFLKWTDKECSMKKLEPTGENKRKVSESVIKLVRFPIMTSTEFADNVVPTKILTIDEIGNILTYITASPGRKPETTFLINFRIPDFFSNGPMVGIRPDLSPILERNSLAMPLILEYTSPNASNYTSRRRMASASRRRNRH